MNLKRANGAGGPSKLILCVFLLMVSKCGRLNGVSDTIGNPVYSIVFGYFLRKCYDWT